MSVFISWSGKRSRRVAEAFYECLPPILAKSKSDFYLSTGIYKGADWNANLNDGLQAANFGILCVTKENYSAPWMIYEAGFLSHKAGIGKVAPFLLDISPSELQGPVTQFQSTVFEKRDLEELVVAVYRSETSHIQENDVRSSFNTVYDKLAEGLHEALAMRVEDGAEDMARKTLAGVEQLLHFSAENQTLLKEIVSGLK